jgi:transposase
LLAIVDDIAPGLTSRYGVGPVSVAQAIVSFSHPGRCRSEAAFASLGGTSPIPASSGQTVRHRLNRGGDRALSRVIHAIALTRMRSCGRTRAYVARRPVEGKTPREIRRCLIGGLSVSRSGQPGRGSPVALGDGLVAEPL